MAAEKLYAPTLFDKPTDIKGPRFEVVLYQDHLAALRPQPQTSKLVEALSGLSGLALYLRGAGMPKESEDLRARIQEIEAALSASDVEPQSIVMHSLYEGVERLPKALLNEQKAALKDLEEAGIRNIQRHLAEKAAVEPQTVEGELKAIGRQYAFEATPEGIERMRLEGKAADLSDEAVDFLCDMALAALQAAPKAQKDGKGLREDWLNWGVKEVDAACDNLKKTLEQQRRSTTGVEILRSMAFAALQQKD